MKNKKGNLMDNALGVLIAVIGLALLAYGVYKVYQTVVNSEEQKVKDLANLIDAKISTLQTGQTGKFLVTAIKGDNFWGLVAWNYSDPNRPDKCSLNSCVCVCTPIFDYTLENIKRDSCQTSGFCRNLGKIDVKIYTFYEKTDYPTVFSDEFVEKFVPGTGSHTTNEIKIISEEGTGDLREIVIYKGKDNIIISYLSPIPYKPKS